MFHLLRSLSLIIGTAILLSCSPTSTALNIPVREGPPVQAPAYKQGDVWTFRVAREGDRAEQNQVLFKNGKFESNNADFFDGAIWATVYRAKDDLKPLDFPLTPGKTWRYTYPATTPRGRTFWREAEVKVIGPTAQPMKTAAGEFEVVEIQRFETLGNATRKTTYFYSPKTKSVVKLTADSSGSASQRHYDMELVQYSAGK